MTAPIDALVLDLLEWLRPGPRPYVEVLDAWRTSCPHLPVWEEANDRGYVRRETPPGGAPSVRATDAGLEYLRTCRGQALPLRPA